MPERMIMTEVKGKVLTGKVVSTAMQGVVVIDIESKKTHRLYNKSYTVNRRIKAKSDRELEIGDIVTIKEVRPISREVHFIVIKSEK